MAESGEHACSSHSEAMTSPVCDKASIDVTVANNTSAKTAMLQMKDCEGTQGITDMSTVIQHESNTRAVLKPFKIL